MELATGGDVGFSDDCGDDSDVLVVEYVSDDETLPAADREKPGDENDNECDDVLKVSTGELVICYYSRRRRCTALWIL